MAAKYRAHQQKAAGVGSPVMRYDGAIVSVYDVRCGDQLMGPDGRPRHVLGTARGRGPLYRIEPVKGGAWVCSDMHVLTLVHTTTGDVVDIDLQSYLAKPKEWKHRYKLFQPDGGIDFPPDAPLPIDPYFLGVWFGDGTKSLRSVSVSKPDAEIEGLMRDMAATWGLHVSNSATGDRCPTYSISGVRGGGNPLLKALREVLDGNPYVIPASYQTSCRRDREALLAGILDTDGALSKSGFDVVQKHVGIAEGIAFIARSLGLRVTETIKLVNGQPYIRMYLSGDCSGLPLRIPRKRAPKRLQRKKVSRTGFLVVPIPDGEYAGFWLDGDGRFLLGDFTVTHNMAATPDLRRAVAAGNRAVFIAHPDTLAGDTHARLVSAGAR